MFPCDPPHPIWLSGLSRAMLKETIGRRLFSGIDPDLIKVAVNAPSGEKSWDRLCRRDGGLKEYFSSGPESKKSLLPLVFLAAQGLERDLDTESSTYLRTAFLREERRIAAYRTISTSILTRIQRSGRECIVVGGSALAETLYDVPHARHSHDIHLLFRDVGERALVIGALIESRIGLASAGRVESSSGFGDGRTVRLSHDSGMTLHCHIGLYDSRFHDVEHGGLWARSTPAVIDGVETRRLSYTDMLVHVVANAGLTNHLPSHLWPCDAHYLCVREPRVDWDFILDVADAGNLSVPLYLGLGGLRNVLDSQVPESVVARLGELAARDRDFRDGEFLQLRRRRFWGPLRVVTGMPGRDRLDAIAHVVWPGNEYLKRVYGDNRGNPRISRIFGFLRGGLIRSLRKIGLLAPAK